MIEVRIFNKDDRLKAAAMFIDNGYRVEQSTKPRLKADGTKTKSVDYILRLDDVRENSTGED